MAKAIKESITETFGFEPILINSALVSAQNRQRLYWVGKREEDGTYSKVEIEQPEDRGILLRDILEDGVVDKEKAYCLKHQAGNARDYFKKHHTQIKFEPVSFDTHKESNIARVIGKTTSVDSKGRTLTASAYKGTGSDGMTVIAEPVCVAQRGRYADSGNRSIKGNGPIEQFYEAREDGKTNALTTVQKDNAIAEPVCLRYERTEEAKKLRKQYENHEIHHGFNEFRTLQPREDGKSNTVSTVQKDNMIAEPVRVGCYPSPDGTLKNSQGMRLYSTEGKSVNLTALGGGMGAKTGLYAIPIEYEGDKPTKAISCADGKEYQVYEVKNGLITIKDKQYPIKLTDGYYIIRKLTVRECMRLQTVPEWYQFPVSDTQAYKMLGNGWTVEVIALLLKGTMGDK